MSEVITIDDLLDDSAGDDVVLVDAQNTIVTEIIWSDIKKNVDKLIKSYNNDTSESVKRIFNSLIMPAYNNLDENYKTSKSFERVLNNTLQLLKNDPERKFAHMQHLYKTMKLHKVKKKASFVTLAINLSDKNSEANTKRKLDNNDNIVKKRKLNTIDLDEEPSIVSIDDKDCDVILLDEATDLCGEKENDSEVLLVTKKFNEVNNRLHSILPINDTAKDTKCYPEDLLVENSLLVPRSTEICNGDGENIDAENKMKIQRIEEKIASYKECIAILEKREVDDDSLRSPYILCDKYKAKIVELYEELCCLTGTDSVKRHEVRLTVNAGHPPGPVRRLEKFLNNRIGSDGLPPFPDFNDVVNCVIISNQIDNLGWNMMQVMRQATSLFTQCGRALQRRRQNREWRHLMDTVGEQRLEVDDPAENDAELEARLQQNRRIAMKKENDLLERYTMMQDLQPNKLKFAQLNKALRAVSEANASSSSSNNKLKESDKSMEKSTEEQENDISDAKVKVKSETLDLTAELEGLGDNYTVTVKGIEDPSLVIEISSDSSSEED